MNTPCPCHPLNPRSAPALLTGWVALMLSLGPALAAPITTETAPIPAEWVVRHNGRAVFRYAFTPGQYKPYVKELCTVEGLNLLRDAPSDHLHHHGLMYAIRLNDVNFWEEIPGSGIQKPVETILSSPLSHDDGVSHATLVQVLHWLTPANAFLPDTTAQALLVERRTLTVSVDAAHGEVAVRWRAEFEVGQATNRVTLGGANYFGLGVRFAAELDPVAKHFTRSGPLDLAGNRQDVSQHPWAAVALDRPTSPATFALFGHPKNRAGAPWFFSMKTPFAYLSATERLDQEPRSLLAGDRFTLDYLVVARSAQATPETLEARYWRWVQQEP